MAKNTELMGQDPLSSDEQFLLFQFCSGRALEFSAIAQLPYFLTSDKVGSAFLQKISSADTKTVEDYKALIDSICDHVRNALIDDSNQCIPKTTGTMHDRLFASKAQFLEANSTMLRTHEIEPIFAQTYQGVIEYIEQALQASRENLMLTRSSGRLH